MIDRQGRPTHKIAFMYWDHDRTQSTRAYKFCFQTHIYKNKNRMRVKLMGVISMLPLPSLPTITNIFRVTHTQRRCWYCVACILVCLVLQTFGSRKCVTAAVTTIISEKRTNFVCCFVNTSRVESVGPTFLFCIATRTEQINYDHFVCEYLSFV